MRYFIELSYKGTNYHGWQIQPNAITVQGELEKAFSTILRKEIQLVGSGRTDAGVHARQQFAHLNIDNVVDVDKLLFKVNRFINHDILIKRIMCVDQEIHARFTAESRAYKYYITQHRDPFQRDLSYLFHHPIDIDKMNEAAAYLIENTDFESFSKVHTDVATFLCTVTEAHWYYEGEQLIFYIKANRFLRGMVRAIVGTLLEVGLGRIESRTFKQSIEAKDRKKAGRAAPPEGLFLVEVNYPKHCGVNA